MNNLFQHIEYLILRHECVVVPGFGAFISRRRQAAFDMENGVILPPSVTVAFNRAVSMDDGLLVNSYIRKHGMTPEEARLAITRAASILQQKLNSERKVSCGKFGSLSMDEEDLIIFTPDPDPLSLIAFSKVPLAMAGAAQTCESSEPATCGPRQSDYYHFRISKKFSRIAAALFAVLAVCLTVILNPIPADDREQRASVLPVETLLSLKSEKNDVTADSIDIPEVEKQEVAPVKELPTHYLIVGTFSSEREAARFSETCESGDFTLEIVPSKKVFRVSAASSDSREELREILNSRECRERFPGSWIWSRQ